jgi:methylated-DNA-[protein]-cysteine S-methyltransferase
MVASNNGLAAILWENDNLKRFSFAKLEENKTHLILLKWEKQLREYFARKRKSFDIDLDFTGSDFQKKVWQVLLTIPFGETRSYTQIATQIGNPKASRAVGAAIGKNPIAVIAPCHRV